MEKQSQEHLAASGGKARAELAHKMDALIAALRVCIEDLEECSEELCAGPMSGLARTIEQAKSALSLATGGTNEA